MRNRYKDYAILEELSSLLRLPENLRKYSLFNIKDLNQIYLNTNVDESLFNIEHLIPVDVLTDRENLTKNELYNLILKKNNFKNKDFYFNWRKDSELPDIELEYLNLGKDPVIFKQEEYSINELIAEVMFEFEIIKDSFSLDSNSIFDICITTGSISNTYELPLSKKSLICIDSSSNDTKLEKKIYIIHEICHACFNYYKFSSQKVCRIEIDEFVVSILEYFWLSKFFNQTELSEYMFLMHLRYNKAIHLTKFQIILYNNYSLYETSKSKNLLFKKIIDNTDIGVRGWFKEQELFLYPFYSASYIIPLKNVIDIYDKKFIFNDIFVDIEHMLLTKYGFVFYN